MDEAKLKCVETSFMTEVSYEPLVIGPPPKVEKPDLVPTLNFEMMKVNL